MPELLDVVSEVSPNGYPIYGDCILKLGDLDIEFHHGRAKVPADHASFVARNRNLKVFAAYSAPATVAPSAGPDSGGVELERRGDVPFAPNGSEEPADTHAESKTPAEIVGDPEAVELAKEYLDQLPEDERPVPIEERHPTEPVAPVGNIERLTADGQERCVARKTDGTQCANKAIAGGSACGLGTHQAQAALSS